MYLSLDTDILIRRGFERERSISKQASKQEKFTQAKEKSSSKLLEHPLSRAPVGCAIYTALL